MKIILYTLLAGILAMPILSEAQTKHSAALEEAKKAIAASNKLYFELYARNDGSLVNLYTEDACLLVPGAAPDAFCGRDAINRFFKEGYDVLGLRNGKFTTTNVYGDGSEYVTEEGLSQMFDANGKLFDEGKYIVLWKKTKDGWKMYKDIFNSNGGAKK
ncbi:MAG TPA: nuclear transport factor 2 family protein [Ohtaekwangia sp.]|uniref:YybH family protein n=1 Tax=Ohtaekwangia sp. TaxID=2066019 RepID=UPI002F9361A8